MFPSCNIPNPVLPKYEKDSNETLTEIKSLGNFEYVAVNGSVFSHRDVAVHTLVIQLQNGNIDGSKDQMYEIGKKALKLLVKSIENESEYDKYQVVFIQKSKEELINKSFTIPIEFSLEDLD